MNPELPDDASTPEPEPNPYEPPRATERAGNAIVRGVAGGMTGCAVALASLVTFVATCFPVGLGLMSTNRGGGEGALFVASLVGIVAAIAVGVALSRGFREKRR